MSLRQVSTVHTRVDRQADHAYHTDIAVFTSGNLPYDTTIAYFCSTAPYFTTSYTKISSIPGPRLLWASLPTAVTICGL